jgi:alpha,alpha-trehalose phosphorylase
MKSGTLDREILWETPAGKRVSITSRPLVSFANRHVAAISYNVTLLNAPASVVISSEMAADGPSTFTDANDPRQTRIFADRVLHHRTSYSKDRRIVLCHATEKSRLILTCATDHTLETSCPHAHKVSYAEDFGQVAFTIDALPDCPIHLTKYMVYHTSRTASPEELCGRAEWNMDRDDAGVSAAALLPRGVHGRFLAPQRCPDQGYQRRTHEAQHGGDTASHPLQPLHILQASARAEDTGVPAKGLTG